MRISEENFLCLDISNPNKKDVLEEVSRLLFPVQWEQAKDSFLKRENEFSTGLVDGFAIPHAKLDFIDEVKFYFINLSKEVEWGTLDDSKVRTLIIMVIPDGDTNQLKILSSISRMMMNQEFKAAVRAQDTNIAQKLIEERL